MVDIWQACQGHAPPTSVSGTLIRVVESQEQIATNALVDNFEEQGLLEGMLEQTKPPHPPGTEKLHWLLATPFRYPPLQHGSRFGSRFEGSLFYGSLSLSTALAETAYYRFLFWQGMTTQPASKKFLTQHTAFNVAYKTDLGAKLHQPPFNDYEVQLTHRSNYTVSQQLGATMRTAGIQAFEFVSARDLDKGTNVALYSAEAIRSTRPMNPRSWLCETTAEKVSFYTDQHSDSYEFSLETYLVEGEFPQPAI